MNVYQIIYDRDTEDGHIVEDVEYVEARTFMDAAKYAYKWAEMYELTLKSVRYALTVVKTLQEADND